MAPRIHHTADGAEALRQKVMGLKRKEPTVTSSRMGISTHAAPVGVRRLRVFVA